MNPSLAYDLIRICAEVNDGANLTLECENVACRVLLPDNPEMPIGIPEHTVLVVFAGSNDCADWLKNISILKKPAPWGIRAPVHGGFLDCFMKIEKALDIILSGHRSVVFAGHSQGGAIAGLAASYFHQRGHTIPEVYTFGSPRPASGSFKAAYVAAGLHDVTSRIVVGWDCVVRHPDSFEDYHCGRGYFYTVAGVPCKSQQRPFPIWKVWRFLWDAVDNHIAANEYTRALRRVAGL